MTAGCAASLSSQSLDGRSLLELLFLGAAEKDEGGGMLGRFRGCEMGCLLSGSIPGGM